MRLPPTPGPLAPPQNPAADAVEAGHQYQRTGEDRAPTTRTNRERRSKDLEYDEEGLELAPLRVSMRRTTLNSTGFAGVYWHKRDACYYAQGVCTFIKNRVCPGCAAGCPPPTLRDGELIF